MDRGLSSHSLPTTGKKTYNTPTRPAAIQRPKVTISLAGFMPTTIGRPFEGLEVHPETLPVHNLRKEDVRWPCIYKLDSLIM